MVEFSFKYAQKAPESALKVIVCSSLAFDFCSPEEQKSLKSAAKQNDFKAELFQVLNLYDGQNRLIAIGCGTKTDDVKIQTLGAKLYQIIAQNQTADIFISGKEAASTAENLAFGIELASYRFDKYFTTKKEKDYPKLEKVTIFSCNENIKKIRYDNLKAVASAVRYARDLCNEPANYLTPDVFAEDIKRLEYLGLKVVILNEDEIKAEGMNMLLSVSQGSHNHPKVAVIRWEGNPDNKTAPELGLVGKGVTFDSGGISLKPSSGMGDMKGDMTGAAVVVATMKAAALCHIKQNITAIVGLVENMPSGHASRPGDIVKSMSGQTVEIINTDAEGRLVLGDCLWYLQQKYNSKVIIDVATLTGSTMRTFGFEYAGLFRNTDKMADNLYKKGLESGEKLWRLPLTEEYDKLINSDIADMKNCGPANGGGITAACFLQRFIKPRNAWAHLDIAGVDRDDKGHPLTPKGATAWGVRLLSKFIGCY